MPVIAAVNLAPYPWENPGSAAILAALTKKLLEKFAWKSTLPEELPTKAARDAFNKHDHVEVINMRVLRKYAFVALLSARSNMVYMAELLSRVVFLAIVLYIFSCLWQVVFKQGGRCLPGEFTLQQMIWYLAATEAIYLSATRVSLNVDLDVRSGALVSYLQRPLSYPLYSLASNLGERGVRLLVNLAVGVLVASILVGIPKLSVQGVLFFCLLIPLSITVDFLGCFLIGLCAFWIEDTSGIFLIYSRITMILGGMLFPITFFPESVRQVIEWLPFAAVLYAPAKMLVAPSALDFLCAGVRQLLALIVFSGLVFAVYRQAGKRVFVNGG
jgi:ABC-2 type transport system permease protein